MRSRRATRRRRSFQKRTVGRGQSLRCPVKALNLARRSALSGSSHQATAPTSARTAASHPSPTPAPSPEAIVTERRDGAAAFGPRSRKRYELRKRGLWRPAPTERGGHGGEVEEWGKFCRASVLWPLFQVAKGRSAWPVIENAFFWPSFNQGLEAHQL